MALSVLALDEPTLFQFVEDAYGDGVARCTAEDVGSAGNFPRLKWLGCRCEHIENSPFKKKYPRGGEMPWRAGILYSRHDLSSLTRLCRDECRTAEW